MRRAYAIETCRTGVCIVVVACALANVPACGKSDGPDTGPCCEGRAGSSGTSTVEDAGLDGHGGNYGPDANDPTTRGDGSAKDGATPTDAVSTPDCARFPGACDAPPDAGMDSAVDSVGLSKPFDHPPTYWGSVDGADCSRQYTTAGFEPDDSQTTRHPLFLYFVGTGATHDAEAPRVVTEAMARRGFVALSVQYDNTWTALLSDHANQLDCLFSLTRTTSVLSVACALPAVDCELGIGTWGHSQGALVAHLAANYDPRVRAAWTTGYGGATEGLFPAAFPSELPKNRWRLVNSEGEVGGAGTVPVLNQLAGFTSSDCPDDGRTTCLRDDGSGWILVRRTDLAAPDLSSADHCWFDRRSCLDANTTLEPNWIDGSSTQPFALEANADWLARTARRP